MLRFAPMFLLCSLTLFSTIGCKGEIARQLPAGASSETKAEAKLCERGDLVACHNVALALDFDASSSDAQRELARSLYLRACDNGIALSCRRLADQAAAQPGASDDAGEAIMIAACARGDVDSCVHVASGRIERGLVDDGMGRLLDLCHQKSSRACMELGRHYLEGTSGHADPVMADRLLEGPCAQGSPVACRMRAEAQLAQATSADAILKETITIFGQACLGSDARACRRLAGLYHAGVGVDQDDRYAESLLKNACSFALTDDCATMIPAPTFAAPTVSNDDAANAADAASDVSNDHPEEAPRDATPRATPSLD